MRIVCVSDLRYVQASVNMPTSRLVHFQHSVCSCTLTVSTNPLVVTLCLTLYPGLFLPISNRRTLISR